MTLRRRLLLFLLPALALSMLAGAVVDYRMSVTATQESYDQALQSKAYGLAAYVVSSQGQLRFAPTVAALDLLNSRPGINRAARTSATALRDDNAAMFYAISGPNNAMIAGDAALAAAALQGGRSGGGSDVSLRGLALRAATIFTAVDVGTIAVTVAETRQSRVHTERVMLLGKLLVDFAELNLMLLIIWFAVYIGLRPLHALRERVELRSARDLQRFDEARVPGELRPVVQAFNRVLELLHAAALSQHRFVADAAHQIRTPVAGLMAQVELLLQEPAAAGLQSDLLPLQQGIQRLSRSANQLLALARAEPVAALHEHFRRVELRQLAEALVERHLGQAERAGIDLGVEAEAIAVKGDPWLLEDLLENLVDNALKYTPGGGRVTVRTGRDAGRASLEVEDNGPGIPESERARVRERFYRRPGTQGIGCGLGLAIVDEIARLHQAEFQVRAGKEGGACMRILFATSQTEP